MMPMFHWTLDPESAGENLESVTLYNAAARPRLMTPIAYIGSPVDTGLPETLTYSKPESIYPASAQIVVVARREAEVFVGRDPDTETEAEAAIRAELAAITALGAWVDVDPHDPDFGAFAESSGGYSYSAGDPSVAYYRGFAQETKFHVRAAPPYSSRCKVVYQVDAQYDSASHLTDYPLESDPPAGTSYQGIPRCIPLPLADPLTDDHWIYLTASPVALASSQGVYTTATILYAHSYREPLP